MIAWNRILETERIKKLPSIVIETPHHRQPPKRIASEQANHRSRKPATIFATKSALSNNAASGGMGNFVFVQNRRCQVQVGRPVGWFGTGNRPYQVGHRQT
jgi:hypothetical protein